MSLKTTLAALILALVPAVGSAACLDGHQSMSTSACPEGQVWDAPTQTCVQQVTG